MVEVSHVFESYRIEEALERILKGKGLDLMMASTDYGQSFADFKEKWLEKVTNKTTIMILGDARNNFGKGQDGHPEADPGKKQTDCLAEPGTQELSGERVTPR